MAANGVNSLGSIDASDYRDSTMHTYTVTKYDDAGTMRVSVAVDRSTLDTQLYSFFNDDTSTEGFGIFGSTPGLWDLTVDDVVFKAIPEPATMGLLGLGGLLALLRSRSR